LKIFVPLSPDTVQSVGGIGFAKGTKIIKRGQKGTKN